MGDRANIVVKQDDGTRIYLYTHWRGYELPGILQAALERGSDRWDDLQYLSRIIFQQMMGGDTGTTGFGISAAPGDNEHPYLVVDCDAQTVTVESVGCFKAPASVLSFKDFAAPDGDMSWDYLTSHGLITA